jgi:hypothetical protein
MREDSKEGKKINKSVPEFSRLFQKYTEWNKYFGEKSNEHF